MQRPGNDRAQGRTFADVDASEDPTARVRYLDEVTRAAQAYKQNTYRMIDLNRGDRVLDIGCGAGDDVRAMAAIVGATGRAVGVDVSRTMIEEARRRSRDSGQPGEFFEASAYELPFEADSFDAARLDRVLQHLDDPIGALREAARVTRPGGRIVAVDPDFQSTVVTTSYPALERRIRDWWAEWREAQPGDGSRGRYLYEHFLDSGLDDVRIETASPLGFDLTLADTVLGLISIAHDAADAGAITREEARRWEQDLQERAARGRFLVSFLIFIVHGRVPG